MATVKKKKAKELDVSPTMKRAINDFVLGIGMRTKKPDQYLKNCYLCGTACSASNNSKGVWITDKVMASLCGGCFDRTNGWTKQDKSVDQSFLDFAEKDLLFGRGFVNSHLWYKDGHTLVMRG